MPKVTMRQVSLLGMVALLAVFSTACTAEDIQLLLTILGFFI